MVDSQFSGKAWARALQWLDFVGFALLAAYAVMAAVALASPSRSDWVDLLVDDAYYYLGLARNMVVHGRSAYSLPFDTNGYQPLWMGLVAATAGVLGTSEKLLVGEALFLCVGLTAAFAIAARRLHGLAFPAVIAALAFPAVSLKGMETAALPLLCLLYLRPEVGWRRKGVLGSLLFLARLDALSLLVVADLMSHWRRPSRDLRHWLIIGPTMLAYFACNLWFFDIAVPVSGLVKSAPGVPTLNPVAAGQAIKAAVTAVGVPALMLAAVWLIVQPKIRFRREIVVVSFVAAINCAYYTVASGWAIWDWYLWPLTLLLYFILSELTWQSMNACSRRALRSGCFSAAGALTFCVAMLLFPTFRDVATVASGAADRATRIQGFGVRNARDAEWFRAKGAHDLRIGMGDRAGSLGFFLPLDSLFQAEGLVAPIAYWQAMSRGDGATYVSAMPFDYWIADRGQFMSDGTVIGVPEPAQPFRPGNRTYLLCFEKSAVLKQEDGAGFTRIVFDWRGRTECPRSMLVQFRAMTVPYGELRKFSMPAEFPFPPAAIELVRRVVH